MKVGYFDNISQDGLTVLFISALLYPQRRKRMFLQTAAVAIASSHTLSIVVILV